jgi:hypothetical protein
MLVGRAGLREITRGETEREIIFFCSRIENIYLPRGTACVALPSGAQIFVKAKESAFSNPYDGLRFTEL